MTLIDSSYFTIDTNAPDNKYVQVQSYIDRYEPEILKKLLGLELFRLVMDETTIEQRIIDLRDGVDYDVDGVLHHWNGLKNEDEISLIAYYVYYWYLRLSITDTTTQGEVQVNPENANIANMSLKIQGVWISLEDLYGSECRPDNYESAFGYLNYFKELYPEWHFEEIGSINAFDL